jgi:type VI secretion system secreted protein VgrG
VALETGKGVEFTFEAGGLDSEVLRVSKFQGSEGLSELFGYELGLVSAETSVSFDDVVGKSAKFRWATSDGERVIHGIVSRFEQSGQGRHLTYYAARLVPKVWTLTLMSKSRIFQNKSTAEILKAVLTDAGIPAEQFKLSLKGSYPARKYCVQYRESDFDFLSRLMEEEGIWYCFEHDDEKCVMLLADDPSTPQPIAGDETVVFREAGLAGKEEVVSFRFARAMRTGSVVLHEFDFKKPKQSLKVEAKADAEAHLQAYDYPGEYPDAALGKRLAKVRLEQERAERELGRGASDCRRLESGHRFQLEDHPVEDLNQEYLLARVEHWGVQKQGGVSEGGDGGEEERVYQNTFECIPSAVPWRPPRVTPRPRVEGPQTAIVTTPAEEEIHCDEHGRVKVKFHWDLEGPSDEKSSCWVRVSQGWGSAAWGAMFLPRKDDEVIVEFLEGDPDRPIITGRVYNGTNPPPYALPGEKTKSSIKTNSSPGGGGFNEVRFEDAKGSEEIFLHGEKDWNIVIKNDETHAVGRDRSKTIDHDETTHVKNNRTETVDKEESITIGGGRTEKVAKDESVSISGSRTESVAKDETITITGNRTETVSKDEDITIKGSRTKSVAKDEAVSISGKRGKSVDKDETVTIGEKYSQTVGKDAVIDVGKKLTILAGDEIVLKTGSASITLKKGGDVVISGGKVDIKASGNLTLKGSQIAQN